MFRLAGYLGRLAAEISPKAHTKLTKVGRFIKKA